MNIDQFVVLEAVVRLGSFSAAAKELHRVQSAVSYNVKSLEEELGLTIFTREGYRPKLTPAGEAIYRKAKGLLLEVEEIELLGKQLRQGKEALVKFDISPVCPMEKVAPILKEIAEAHAQTQLKITMEVFGGEALVLNNEVDVSLTDLVQPDDGLDCIPWMNVDLIPVASPSHPLGKKAKEVISRADVLKFFQIVVRSTTKHTEAKSLGIHEGTVTWSVNDFNTKKRLLIAGLGWGNMPAYMVAEDLAAHRLVVLNMPHFPVKSADLCLVRKRWKAHGPVATHLWELLKEQRLGRVGQGKGFGKTQPGEHDPSFQDP